MPNSYTNIAVMPDVLSGTWEWHLPVHSQTREALIPYEIGSTSRVEEMRVQFKSLHVLSRPKRDYSSVLREIGELRSEAEEDGVLDDFCSAEPLARELIQMLEFSSEPLVLTLDGEIVFEWHGADREVARISVSSTGIHRFTSIIEDDNLDQKRFSLDSLGKDLRLRRAINDILCSEGFDIGHKAG